MDAQIKIARQRLSVLELAQRLGNVAEACRRRGMDRTSFFEWRKRFETQGLEGLKDLPPVHKTHPQTTPAETVEKIKALALAHPGRGCGPISAALALEGIRLSSVTVQEILNRNDLGTRRDRWLALERKNAETAIALSDEQVKYLEKLNPCFKERHVESSAPGELLSADTFTVGAIKGIGRIVMHTMVDTYGSMAFGILHTGKQPEAAVSVLHNDVLPFYKEHGLAVKAVLTDNGREFCGTQLHPYEMYLALNGIEHRRTNVRTPRTNGFVERFNRTVKDEFFAVALRNKLYPDVATLQADLDEWLTQYNYTRPHLGYRNQGKRPFDTFAAFIKPQPAKPTSVQRTKTATTNAKMKSRTRRASKEG